MVQKYYKNSITAILISSFLLMPLASIPKKAEAQSIAGSISGLAPAILQLPLCKGKITSAVSSIFGGSSALAAANAAGNAATDAVNASLSTAVGEGLGRATGIQTFDPVGNATLNRIEGKVTTTDKNVSALTSNDTCIRNIGQLVVKMLLQKLTVSTVNWINSGFDGKPAFIQDPGKFFKDIAKNEILQFGLEINNPELFPFGKQWLKNQALAYNNKFADNARYSLNELIQQKTPQYSAESFNVDFSQGGWDAWSAMTQVPANNPLGFQLLASNELSKRLQGTEQSTAQNVQDALKQANGFLGDNRCMAPEGLTKQQDAENKIKRSSIGPEPNINNKKYTDIADELNRTIKYSGDLAEWQSKMFLAPICTNWQYVTPGALIAKAATDAVGYPRDSLLKADDLNSAIAAVLDALLSRFSTTIMQKGFAALGSEGSDGSYQYDNNSVNTGGNSSQTEKDYTPQQLASSWFGANPDFNIRTDLTQALIDEQRTYSDKLKLQNKELNSTTDGKDFRISNGVSNAYGLIPVIDQLDYCVPGPHPGWEDDSRAILGAATSVINPLTAEDMKDQTMDQVVGAAKGIAPLAGVAIGAALASSFASVGGLLGSVIPVAGTVVGAAVGALIGWAVGAVFGGGDYNLRLRAYYSLAIQSLTGVGTDYRNDESGLAFVLMSKQGAVQALNVMLERYIKIVHTVYNSKILPTVYKEAASQYDKLNGYAQILANNDSKIFDMKNVVTTLGQIKNEVDKLNTKRENGQIKDEDYEIALRPQIDAFGRLSASMVNGDDIASADSLAKQIVDERNYVYKNLLKGPYGCEKDLENNVQGMSLQLQQTTRMDYPFPTLYTYNMKAGDAIPDPYPDVSGLVVPNKTNANATGLFGPGFLSYYSFQRDGKAPKPGDPYPSTGPDRVVPECTADATGAVPWCELKLIDIVPINDNHGDNPGNRKRRQLGTVSAGSSTPIPTPYGSFNINNATSGPFEHTIGAY